MIMKSENPTCGKMLVSEPFLLDINFSRSVVLLCEHNEEGSVGFVLNKLLSINTDEFVPNLLTHIFPVFYGGPVEQNTLHFIHRCGPLIKNAQKITDDIWWGGNIEDVNELMNKKLISAEDFKFFLGYSGWASGQLVDELNNKSWWVVDSDEKNVFTDDLEEMWSNVVSTMGENFKHLAKAPLDPQWN